MKAFVVLAVNIVLVSMLFCSMAMAAPPMPYDVQMVEPDPSLPKELAGFCGKWEGHDGYQTWFLIVEKIDEEKAGLYLWRSGTPNHPGGWSRFPANVGKQYGKYSFWFRSNHPVYPGNIEFVLKGNNLDCSIPPPGGSFRLKRVP
jgi:hypothetical protein